MRQDHPYSTLGADIRALRKARGITLTTLSETLGRSVGWLSQVERDLSAPSIEEVRALSKALSVPVSMLFGQPEAPVEEQGYIVRKQARRQLRYGNDGLTEELLSPDLTDDFEVFHTTIAPNAKMETMAQRETQEVGYVVSGQLTLYIGEGKFELTEGDSFRVRGEEFRWENRHDIPAVVIWVIAPPIY